MAQTSALQSLRSSAVGDWEPCGDTFYAREQLYDMAWKDVDLEDKILCCAPFGGPIAVTRDPERVVRLAAASASARPVVRTFTAAGAPLGSFLWEGGRLAGWGWTDQLELALVDGSGRVHFYSVFGARQERELSFGRPLEAEGVCLAVVWGAGVLVAGAASGTLWAATGLAAPRALRLPALPDVAGPPGCVAVLEPRMTQLGALEVVAGAGGRLWLLDETSATDHELPAGSGGAVALAASPDGSFVAVVTADARLLVMAADLSSTLSEFSTGDAAPPSSLAWCGGDAVALRWEGLLLLVGPYGDHLRWASDEPVALVAEVDGLRLVGSATHTLVRRVADCVVQVFKPGSTAPVAVLWDARDAYDAGSARSDRLLRDLRGRLDEAVGAAIEAAGLDLSVPRQRALLQAAVLGRPFCAASFPPTALHDAVLRLRVLNAVRAHDVGLALTGPQLEALTLPVLVARLVALRHYLLAYRIAGALGAGQDAVAAHWAAAKITARPDMTDAQLREALVARLRATPGARFAPLAAHAQAVGRRALAVSLLEEEPSAAQQVPLLLSLARGEGGPSRGGGGGGAAASPGDDADATLARALKKAIESGDTDLVHLALFAAYKTRPLPVFWALIAHRSLARNLFAKYMRAQEPELLETIYTTQTPGGHELPDLQLTTALRRLGEAAAARAAGAAGSSGGGGGRPDDAAVTKFVAALGEVAAGYAQSRERAFAAKAASDFASLAKEQARLERDTGQALYLGLSLADTLRTLLRLGHARQAAALRKSFGVGEARWCWLRLGVLAAARDWEALEAFAAERKSPIGWGPFLEAAQKHGAPREYQARLIARMPDSAAKAEAYAAIEYPREAAEVAAKLRDGDLFGRIQAAVSATSPAGLAIAQLRDRFQASFR